MALAEETEPLVHGLRQRRIRLDLFVPNIRDVRRVEGFVVGELQAATFAGIGIHKHHTHVHIVRAHLLEQAQRPLFLVAGQMPHVIRIAGDAARGAA